MSESGDYDPGPWKGYDFASARRTYDVHVGRSYDDAVSKKVAPSKLIIPKLVTQSTAPLVIACDVTGSMGDWPATIFSKLPYLDKEGQEYLGKDLAISFAAIGDAYSDNYPLQVRDFAQGKDLEKRLKELIIEGNGGGQTQESYDLAALYYARNCDMPKAVQPIFIYIGDEGLYPSVDKTYAKEWSRVDLEGKMTTKDAIGELQKRFSVYLVRKPYELGRGDIMGDTDKRIYGQWCDYLGEDHIATLPDASRVVDVIFGILAEETSRVPYFLDEIAGRQKPGQVKTALKALETIHAIDGKSAKLLKSGMSRYRGQGKGGSSKSLL
jgi:hypothetical protein